MIPVRINKLSPILIEIRVLNPISLIWYFSSTNSLISSMSQTWLLCAFRSLMHRTVDLPFYQKLPLASILT